MDNYKHLLEKISKLKDLRQAINIVKQDTNIVKTGQHEAGLEKQNPMQEDKAHAQEAVQEASPGGYIKHLGVKSTVPGVVTHMVGTHGSDHHYEIDVNMNHMANDMPAFSINHIGPGGKIKSRSPMMHDNIQGAIGSLMGHHHHGTWPKPDKE